MQEKLIVTGRNFRIRRSLQSHIEEKLEKVFTINSRVIGAEVEVAQEGTPALFTVTGHLRWPGPDVSFTAQADDPFAAVNDLQDKMLRKLRRRKRAYIARRHTAA